MPRDITEQHTRDATGSWPLDSLPGAEPEKLTVWDFLLALIERPARQEDQRSEVGADDPHSDAALWWRKMQTPRWHCRIGRIRRRQMIIRDCRFIAPSEQTFGVGFYGPQKEEP